MANDATANPIIVDTAGASLVVDRTVTVRGVRWEGATTAGNEAIIQDAGDREVWKAVADAANFLHESALPWKASGGFKVPTLDSGKLYIYYEGYDVGT